MDKQIFGKFIADRRRELGMTQQGLADRLCVTDKAVSKWERGLSYPDLTLLEALAGALEVSVSELMACRKALPPESQVSSLMDIAQVSNRRLKKKYGVILGVLGLVMLLLAAGLLLHLTRWERQTEHVVFWGKDASQEGSLLYVEKDGRLLTLTCSDPQIFDSIVPDGRHVYCISYAFDPRTYRGVLEDCEADPEAAVGFTHMALQGSAMGVESLFGVENMILEYRDVYPDPKREDKYLYTLRYYYCGDGKDYYLGKEAFETTVLIIEDCRDAAQGDFDGDGTAELFVLTRYDEAPYQLYDCVDGKIVSRFVEEMPPLARENLYFQEITFG